MVLNINLVNYEGRDIYTDMSTKSLSQTLRYLFFFSRIKQLKGERIILDFFYVWTEWLEIWGPVIPDDIRAGQPPAFIRRTSHNQVADDSEERYPTRAVAAEEWRYCPWAKDRKCKSSPQCVVDCNTHNFLGGHYITLFVILGFIVPLENYSLIWGITIASEGLQILTYTRHSWPLSCEGCLAYHTYW